MTAPIDRAWVEVLPDLRRFAEETKTAVRKQGAAVQGAMAPISKAAEKSAKESEGFFKKSFGNIRESAKGYAKFAVGAFAGLFAVEGVKGFIDAAREAQRVTAQTAAVIKSTGGAAHVTAGFVIDLASKISEYSGIEDDTIQSTENLLLTFTSIRNSVGKNNDIFTQATKTVIDMSVALKEDTKSAAIQLGKALQDPVRGITALRRVGVSFTESQQKQIKTLVDTGHTLQAQKMILKELNKEFGGSAAAQATAGSKMRATWHVVQEELGKKLLPVVDKVDTGFVHFLHGVTGNVEIMNQRSRPKLELFGLGLRALFMAFRGGGVTSTGFIGSMEQVGVALRSVYAVISVLIKQGISLFKTAWTLVGQVLIKVIVPALRAIADFIKTHGTLVRVAAVAVLSFYAAWLVASKVVAAIKAIKLAMEGLNAAMRANVVLLIISAIVALTLAFIYAYKHSERFRDTVNHVLDNLKHAFDNFMHAVDNVKHGWDNLYHAGENAVHAFSNVVNFLKRTVPITLAILFPFVSVPLLIWKNWSAITGFLRRVWNDVYAFLRRWGPVALTVLVPFIGIPLVIWRYWSQIIGFLRRVWNDVWGFLKRWGPIALLVLAPFLGIPLIIWRKWSVIMDFGRRLLGGFLRTAQGAWGAISRWFTVSVPQFFGNVGAGATKWLVEGGKNILRGLWNGIKALGAWLVNQVKSIIPGWIKTALGIASPPQWAKDIGGWIAKGLAHGITHNFPHFLGNLAKMAREKLAAAASAALNYVSPELIGGMDVRNDVRQYVAFASSQFGRYGWAQSQLASLIALWNRESGWNPFARNSSSGAYGIPQALPAQKMATAGADWMTNFATQIRWGLQYIKDTYGTPGGAYAHEAAFNWYAKGLPPTLFTRPTVIGVGERGAETVSVTPKGKTMEVDLSDRAAAKIARELAKLTIQMDGRQVAELVTRRQSLVAAKGVRR